MIRFLAFGFFILTLSSCYKSKDKLPNDLLQMAGSNRTELLKVLAHYSRPTDSLKLRAAVFLIKNMKYKKSYSSEQVSLFHDFFQLLDSRWVANTINEKDVNAQLRNVFDSLDLDNISIRLTRTEDIKYIKSSYLIENIDDAFTAWTTYSWSQSITFDDFCEYILPYNVYDEPIQPWRKEIMKRFSWLQDSVKNLKSLKEVVTIINMAVEDDMLYVPIMKSFPTAISFKNLERGKVGKCEHLVTYKTYILRALGIPVQIDFVPYCGNNSSGHTWNSIKDEQGQLLTFDGIYYDSLAKNLIPEALLRNRKAPKIYRKSYAIQDESIEFIRAGNVPQEFFDINRKDVTSEYVPRPVNLKFRANEDVKDLFVYLCVYSTNSWKISSVGRKQADGLYHFENIGRGIVYLPVTYKEHSSSPAGQPFILHGENDITSIQPDFNRLRTLTLERKYFIDYDVKMALSKMVGGIFQGANLSDFGDFKDIYKITSPPVPKTNVFRITSNDNYYRFFRFIIPNNLCRVAELRFFGITSGSKDSEKLLSGTLIGSLHQTKCEPKNVIDGDILTYFVAKSDNEGYVGIDLGENDSARLTKIEFYPPSDGNSVEIGDVYELFYWSNGWKSLGVQKAKQEELVYSNCPDNALFRLRDLTKGYKERIFTYEQNKQVWW